MDQEYTKRWKFVAVVQVCEYVSSTSYSMIPLFYSHVSTNPVVITTRLTQELLWALVGLVDAAVSNGGSELAGSQACMLETLVPLLALLRTPEHGTSSSPHVRQLSHVAALVARLLHVMAAGDDVSKQLLADMAVVPLLVHTISQEEGHAAGANSAGAEAHASSSDATAQHRTHLHAGMALQSGASANSSAGAGVTAWDRVMAALLIRAALKPARDKNNRHPEANNGGGGSNDDNDGGGGVSASGACSWAACDSEREGALAGYALLLPLISDLVTPPHKRLCVVKECVVGVKTLVLDAPQHADQAVHAGAIPVLVSVSVCVCVCLVRGIYISCDVTILVRVSVSDVAYVGAEGVVVASCSRIRAMWLQFLSMLFGFDAACTTLPPKCVGVLYVAVRSWWRGGMSHSHGRQLTHLATWHHHPTWQPCWQPSRWSSSHTCCR